MWNTQHIKHMHDCLKSLNEIPMQRSRTHLHLWPLLFSLLPQTAADKNRVLLIVHIYLMYFPQCHKDNHVILCLCSLTEDTCNQPITLKLQYDRAPYCKPHVGDICNTFLYHIPSVTYTKYIEDHLLAAIFGTDRFQNTRYICHI